LARELGLTNKETLDLCASLGIGVKSHSSSIEDAQADRVRRKAEREGLKREVQPEEPKPAKKAEKAEKAPAEPPAAAAVAAAPAETSPQPAGRPADPTHRLVTSRPLSEQPDVPLGRPPPRPAPLPRPAARPAEGPPAAVPPAAAAAAPPARAPAAAA